MIRRDDLPEIVQRVLLSECPLCGSYRGSRCTTAGGKEITDLTRQHTVRLRQAGVVANDGTTARQTIRAALFA
ncbi:zinc finger domain-containing protein [Tenggerimyces flavus]|uniref:DNA-binding phage zinc finger domain-containing protein n=1 Tax=Tenggerimyces flavus TaxID=1708749 RepID=A0ABV7YKN3_9ACTN|nr:hypothetical protein [Tenggerimyces flavus]MBM7784760.1 hypothetical protein [Tenggerimyces flavus]